MRPCPQETTTFALGARGVGHGGWRIDLENRKKVEDTSSNSEEKFDILLAIPFLEDKS
jgi:hypothetical protein